MPRVYHARAPSIEGARSVMLATPARGGLSASYTYSLALTLQAFAENQIAWEFVIESENFHGDDARNAICRTFLDSPCTDLLFIDADQGWDADAMIEMIRASETADIVGAGVIKKGFPEGYNVNFFPGELWSDERGLIEIAGVGTGIILIRRHVIEKLSDVHKDNHFFSASDNPQWDRPMVVLFERTIGEHRRWSGDLEFCRKWRAVGGKVHLFPDFHHEHCGEFFWAGHIGNYLKRANAIEDPEIAATAHAEIVADLIKLRNGDTSGKTLARIIRSWGNPKWAAAPDFQVLCMSLAREATGPILECGSGLSTLLMAACTTQEVWALEHESQWFHRVKALAAATGLTNVNVWYAPLRDRTAYSWYALPDPLPRTFSLVVCDGPPGNLYGGRTGLFREVGDRIEDAVIVMDDAKRPVEASVMEDWAQEHGREIMILDSTRATAIIKARLRIVDAAD